MPRFSALAVVFAALLTGACASGPEFSEARKNLRPVAPDEGRVYFFRTQIVGAAVQPTIFVDGADVGSCEPDGVFFVDLKPGKHVANVETEVERQLSFVLAPGEEKFVRCYVSIGILVGRGNLELVGANEAATEISGLSFTGG